MNNVLTRSLLLFCLALGLSYAQQAPLGEKDQVLQDEYRLGSFTHMHQIYPSRVIHRSGQVRNLKRKPQDLSGIEYTFDGEKRTLEDYMERASVMGFIVLKNEKVLFETYRQETSELDYFASWSMAKSVTSTLMGLALEDGYIADVEDPLVDYVADLKESAYKDNSIEDLLQMTSGVEFIEDYVNTDSLEATAWFSGVINQQLPYNKTILWFDKRIAPPGQRYYYATMEPQVVGWVVTKAANETLSDYLSKEIWQKLGMEHDAFWMIDRPGGMELAGCCISATLRDYARLGLLFLNNGKMGQEQLIPKDWIKLATRPDPDKPFLHPGADPQQRGPMGYQHYWWLWPDGAYSARGLGGQELYIDPAHDLVIVQTAAWGPGSGSNRSETRAVIGALVQTLN